MLVIPGLRAAQNPESSLILFRSPSADQNGFRIAAAPRPE
jgi:hypothetical protein